MTRWTPAPPLAGLVISLWDLESYGAYTRERIPPRTHFDLLINLGEPHWLLNEREDRIAHRRAWIAGLQDRYLDIESPPSSRLMGAQLTAAGARSLTQVPLSAIAGRVVEIEDILGCAVAQLRERLFDCGSAAARLELLEQWLARRTAAVAPAPGAFTQAAVEIVRSRGSRRIGELAREAGVSHKHLIALFETNLGLAPKSFARLVRFNALLDRLKRDARANWADLVFEFGYFDHAHFARDLRRFTGASPTAFLRSRGPDGDTVVVSG